MAATGMLLDWINRLNLIKQQVYEFNKIIKFKKFKKNGRVMTTLEPTSSENQALHEIVVTYQDVINEILSYLDTYPKFKRRFSYFEENAVSYIFFERIGGDIDEQNWREQFVVEFDAVIGRLTTFIEELIEMNENKKIRCFQQEGHCHIPVKKQPKQAFVIMPFNTAFHDIYRYGIQETLEQIGIKCIRADEIMQHSRNIMCRSICRPILESAIVIADMTDKNSNVFFELGLSYGFEKEVILIAQKIDDIPFDLRSMNTLIYDGTIAKLKDGLPLKLPDEIN